MREILFRGKRFEDREWVYGHYAVIQNAMAKNGKPERHIICNGTNLFNHKILPETVGQFTGVKDTELKPIYEGDIVRFLRYVGKIVFEEGCFGIAISFNDVFDWDYIDEEMKEYAGTNQITSCFNDHFISLWEILSTLTMKRRTE